MKAISLSQSEADELLHQTDKYLDEPQRQYDFPVAGEKLAIPMHDLRKREQFILDLRQSPIRSVQVSMNHRVRGCIILARLDIEGQFHTNPDGVRLPRTHIHLYREGFGDKFAYKVEDIIPGLDTTKIPPSDIAVEFLKYCKAVELPSFAQGLPFS